MIPYPILIGVFQLIPAIILMAYGATNQKRVQPYFDMLVMALPATLFYGLLMRNLPGGLFEWYFYFIAKFVLFLVPGLILIQLRNYELSEFCITKEGLRLSLLLGFGIFNNHDLNQCHNILAEPHDHTIQSMGLYNPFQYHPDQHPLILRGVQRGIPI